jgi:hypothetical protein
VLINVIGGMVIGIVQQGLTFAEAAHTYTLLTVGDCLVTQVPALIASPRADERAGAVGNPSARPAQDRGQHLRHSRGRAGAPLGPMAAIRFPEQWLVACSSAPSGAAAEPRRHSPVITVVQGSVRPRFQGNSSHLAAGDRQFSFGCGSRPFSLARNDRRDAMNHSMYSADGRTHLKIVVIGLLCATLVAAVGIFAQVRDVDLGTAPLVKAGQPTAMTGRLPSIR